MASLPLRFAAPLQAWGKESSYNRRRTELYPSKSAVVGLIASALGRGRDDDISDLARLRMGVRIDRPGRLIVDYQITKMKSIGYQKYGLDIIEKKNNVAEKEYLSDAAFLVVLESEDESLLRTIADAIRHPMHMLYLGRKCCPPTLPIVIGSKKDGIFPDPIRQEGLEDVLRSEPPVTDKHAEKMRIYTDAPSGFQGMLKKDMPVSFSITDREYAYRRVCELPPLILKNVKEKRILNDKYLTGHDAFSVIPGEVDAE